MEEPSNIFVILFALFVLGLVLKGAEKRWKRRQHYKRYRYEAEKEEEFGSNFDANFRFAKKKALLNKQEHQLHALLREVLPSDKALLSMVRIADVLQPAMRKSDDRRAWYTAFNSIKAKHFDFVICSSQDMEPIGAVELDGPTHMRADRRERDRLVDYVCASAKFPLVHIKTGSEATKDPRALKHSLPEAVL